MMDHQEVNPLFDPRLKWQNLLIITRWRGMPSARPSHRSGHEQRQRIAAEP